ncbi:MAG: hypothetical protein LE180_05865 [Endomicrobium sp.]|uniref:hypothetical protein n=1 Tax=Candidatus Endomicrobiellum pyrsonymphae TaxID=1408203 RepID=UPI0035897444|nr:hypothetical protein [Endomicrobium sp.]
MFKKMLVLAVFVFSFASLSLANKTYVVDTPTTGALSYGTYDVGVRCFSSGNIISNINFGVFKLLNIGVSWELDKLIGNDQVQVAVPALNVKLRLYEGSMVLPQLAIGYDGQGYFIDNDYSWKYLQRGKGLYVVIGRELFIDGLMLNVGANVNNSKAKVYGFINVMVPVYKEIVYFMTEYDNINYFPHARLNCGLKFALTEYIDVDCIIRDCWGKESVGRVPNERVLRISYSGKF